MGAPSVKQRTAARIPTVFGEFRLAFFDNSLDDKEHLALVYGQVEGKDDVLVRIHSECFTGDVLGSRRCDCGEQLTASMQHIAEEGTGLVLYLRQEGRGIGLLNKLKAYNLQDDGYDTVDANLMLGHEADERDYTLAALMLRDFDIGSVRLLTNNPSKVEQLRALGIEVSRREPLQPSVHAQNERYLRTKAQRMRHELHVNGVSGNGSRLIENGDDKRNRSPLQARIAEVGAQSIRPFVTLSYAQSIDGSIAAHSGEPLLLSGEESLVMTHKLRAWHDAILVGVGTVLADDPRLTVRHVDGIDPVPIVLDTHLRFPPDATLLRRPGPSPIIATGPAPDSDRRTRLEERGARVVTIGLDNNGRVCLDAWLRHLKTDGFKSIMVEGGAEVITSFLRGHHVDHVVITIANRLVGGLSGVRSLLPLEEWGSNSSDASPSAVFPRLDQVSYQWHGTDLVVEGQPVWERR